MAKCLYPAHKLMKAKKSSANKRYSLPTVAFEINQWFSSAAKSFNVSVDSNCAIIVKLNTN